LAEKSERSRKEKTPWADHSMGQHPLPSCAFFRYFRQILPRTTPNRPTQRDKAGLAEKSERSRKEKTPWADHSMGQHPLPSCALFRSFRQLIPGTTPNRPTQRDKAGLAEKSERSRKEKTPWADHSMGQHPLPSCALFRSFRQLLPGTTPHSLAQKSTTNTSANTGFTSFPNS
jgi:hypothetical protein